MGAAQSSANNQQAVAALLNHNHAQQSTRQMEPPPGCPMHKPEPKPKVTMPVSSSGGCPIPHDQRDAYVAQQSKPSTSSDGWTSSLNPLNMMPSLSQSQAPSQESVLSTERVISSIPRSRSSPAPGASPYDAPSACPVKHDGAQPEEGAKWEYPSPQQFYNALVRKGWETPEEHVETMVLIHNFLNEQAWLEVLEWEKLAGADHTQAELARFQGKPGTLSPKARLFGIASYLMPSRFSEEPPFDRHDWVIRRPDQGGKEVRYVIDYYSVPDDPDKDEPEFNLDVRPALDSFESLRVRVAKGIDEWRNPTQSMEDVKRTVEENNKAWS